MHSPQKTSPVHSIKAGIFLFNSQAVTEQKLAQSKLLVGPSSLSLPSPDAHSLDEVDSFLATKLPKPPAQPLVADLDQPGSSHINLFSDEKVEEDDTPV